MTTGVVIWDGPIWPELIAPAVPPDWTIKTYSRGAGGGIKSEPFKQWALGLGSDPLSKLAPGADRIILAGYSAGHGANEVILGHVARARDTRLVGLVCADSYYSAWNVKTPKPGFFAWCQFALEQGYPAWFTTSSSHPPEHPSGSESIRPLIDALELAPADPPKNLPAPVTCRRRDSIVWLDYGARFAHEDHGRKLARMVLEQPGIFFGMSGTNLATKPATNQPTSPAAQPDARTNHAPPRADSSRTNLRARADGTPVDKPRSSVAPILAALAVGVVGIGIVAARR